MNKLALALIFTTSSAYADILMLNFNGNNSTIAAAKRAAVKRGERVIVIPKSGEKISKHTLDDEMARLSKEGIEVSSMIFSGHDGGGYFGGRSGGMNKSEVREVMAKYPEMAKGVDSLILRGCYTATPGEAMSLENDSWNGIFPDLNMIAGYIGAAPSSERIYSKSFIEEILSLESDIYMSASVKNVEKMFANISNSKWTSNSLAFKRCGDEDYHYVARPLQHKGYGALTMDEILKICDKPTIQKHIETTRKYYEAFEEGYENPPVAHHGTDLREAYTYLNGVTHCSDFFDDIYLYPSLQQTIKLIYFDYLKSNFLHHYGDDWKVAMSALEDYNKENDPDIEPIDLENATRREIMNFIHKLHTVSAADILDKDKYNYAYNNKDNPSFKTLIRMRETLQQTLQYVNEESVPFDWVSSKHSPEKGIVRTHDEVYISMGLDDNTKVEDLKSYGYRDSIDFYFKNHADDEVANKAAEIALQKLEENYHAGTSDTKDAERTKKFLKYQEDKFPLAIVKSAIRNPQYVDNKMVEKAINKLKDKGFKLSDKEYEFFENSYISPDLDSENRKKQEEAYKKIFKELSRKEDTDNADLLKDEG